MCIDLRRLSGQIAVAFALLLSTAAPGAAQEGERLDYYGSGYDPRDVPGTPRTAIQIYRRLVEDGYSVMSQPLQTGAVYFVMVLTPQGRSKCLILHAFSGVILQRLAEGPNGFTPEIRDAPGPGFPGYPQDPTGRYAEFCGTPGRIIEVDRSRGPIIERY